MTTVNNEVSQEELESEKEAENKVNQDELRSDLAEKYGLDPDEQSDLLDKLTESEMTHREKLSSAIKQKITWREKAQTKEKGEPESKGKPKADGQEDDIETRVDQLVNKRLEERDLKELDLPEEVEEEVRRIARINNVSVREAAKDPYVTFKLEQLGHKEKIDNATPTRSNRGGTTTRSTDVKPPNHADYNLTTEEGRKEWEKAKSKYRESLK